MIRLCSNAAADGKNGRDPRPGKQCQEQEREEVIHQIPVNDYK